MSPMLAAALVGSGGRAPVYDRRVLIALHALIYSDDPEAIGVVVRANFAARSLLGCYPLGFLVAGSEEEDL